VGVEWKYFQSVNLMRRRHISVEIPNARKDARDYARVVDVTKRDEIFQRKAVVANPACLTAVCTRCRHEFDARERLQDEALDRNRSSSVRTTKARKFGIRDTSLKSGKLPITVQMTPRRMKQKRRHECRLPCMLFSQIPVSGMAGCSG
jgi:hypothetical protein